MGRDFEDKDYYIDNSRDMFDFFIEARQWTGFDKIKLNRWINNFTSKEHGEYYACKILNGLIGFSEDDVVRMLQEGIEQIMHREVILPLLVERNFSAMGSEIEYDVNEALRSFLFAPLLIYNSPGESANAMMRLLTQKVKPQVQMKFITEVQEDYPCCTIVLVDDCIGSGEQFEDFWNCAQIKSGKLLRDWCRDKNIRVYYLCLIAFDETLNRLRDEYKDITIIAIEEISKRHEIFCEHNEIWADKRELDEIKREIEDLIADKGISILGHDDLGFGVVIHNSIPDWSLPIFYKEKNDWKLLVERKDSNV